MHGVYIGDRRMLIDLKWGGILVVPSDDLSITPLLVKMGALEEPLTRYLLNNVKKGMKAIDVGAHVGYFTVLLGMLIGEQGRVIAYEPNPSMYSFLRDNINMNYVRNHVNPVNKAVYSTAGTVELHITERFTANSALGGREATYLDDYADTIRTVTVEAESLRARIDELGQVDLIKIDAEGSEYQVFLGMINGLQRGAIDTVVFEYAPTMLRDDLHPFWGLLDQIRGAYDYFHIGEDGALKQYALETLLAQKYLHSIVMKKR